MPEAPLSVEISTSTRNDREYTQTVRLRVEDRVSGEVLTYVEFTPTEFWALIQGSHTWKDGFYTDHPERLGTKMQVSQEKIPDEVFGRTYGDEAKQLAEAWAAEQGYDGDVELRVHQSNRGWMLTTRTWRAEA
jgi:hypothetical protein